MIDFDGLNRLAYQIKTETKKAANTALRVGTLFEDIIAALREGDNTGLLDQITNLKNDISKIINMIKDLNTEIDTSIITRIEANERNISNINNTIQNIQTTINGIQGDINTIEGTLSNHLTLIQTIQGQITTINNSIGAINTQLTNITNTISTITSDLSALTTRVSKNETNIDELKKRLDAIDLDPIIAAINKLNADLNALTNRVSSAELEINALNEFTSALSGQIAEEEDRAMAAEEALGERFNDYLPLAGGTMTGTIVLPKSSNNSRLGIATGPSSSDVFLGYDDISNYFGSTNKVTEIIGPIISIGADTKVGIGSNDEVSIIAVNKLFLQGASQLVMKTPTIYWTTDSTDGMKLISNKTNIGFDVFNTTYDPILNVKTKARIKTASSGSTSYEMLHEGNSVYVVSSYPTDLSSYPDGAIFIKTS